MIEFKQIIGRGTRLFEGKEFFTLYDFVGAYRHFLDPDWDGEPLGPETYSPEGPDTGGEESGSTTGEDGGELNPGKVKIKLRDGKEREIRHMVSTFFWSAGGKPMSSEEFLNSLFGKLPDFYKSEAQLRKIWSLPSTRKALLAGLDEAGFGKDELAEL